MVDRFLVWKKVILFGAGSHFLRAAFSLFRASSHFLGAAFSPFRAGFRFLGAAFLLLERAFAS